MPGARRSAAYGCLSGITSWSPWPGLRTSPIKYSYYICLIAVYMMTSSNANISASLALCEWGPPVTGGFPLTGTSDVELWLFLWPAPQQTVTEIMETPVIWDASDFGETHCLLMVPNIIYYYIVSSDLGDGLLPTAPSHRLNQYRFDIIGIHPNFVIES